MSQSTLQSLQLHVDDAKQSLLQNSMHMLYLYINVVFYETFDRKEKQGIAWTMINAIIINYDSLKAFYL